MRPDPDICRDPVLLAAEVRRLRAVIDSGEPTLTDEERDAIEAAASWLDASDDPDANRRADTIYGFLNRAK